MFHGCLGHLQVKCVETVVADYYQLLSFYGAWRQPLQQKELKAEHSHKFVSAPINETETLLAHLMNSFEELEKDYFQSQLTSAGTQLNDLDEPIKWFLMAVASILILEKESSLVLQKLCCTLTAH